MRLAEHLEKFPFIAILRGVRPEEATACGEILVKNGFRIIEVPLNSPEPFRSIEILREKLPPEIMIGAGTVTELSQVQRLHSVGASLVVSPHTDRHLIKTTKGLGMTSLPGAATPSEAMKAITAGADGLKLFPAEIITPAAVKALRAVLPPGIPLIPVGSIDQSNWKSYTSAGATGFGLGSSLYKSGMSLETLAKRAAKFAREDGRIVE